MSLLNTDMAGNAARKWHCW